MAGTRVPFASLAALAAVASAQAQQSETSATESAKRDLKSLPSVQRPVETTAGKTLFPGSSAVPALSLGTPTAPAKSRDNTNTARSTNWLLDGVNQLEAETNAERDANDATKRADALTLSGPEDRRTTATTNPFGEYLTQWLSPGDQAMLAATGRNASSSSAAPWETPRSEFQADTTRSPSAPDHPLQMELPGLADFSGNDRAGQNPYLVDPFQTEQMAGTAIGVPLTGREAPESLPSILTPSQSLSSPVAPAQIEQARPAPATAPTDRLIDDRKYFPQLRRF